MTTACNASDRLTQSRQRLQLALSGQGAATGDERLTQQPLQISLGLAQQVAQWTLQPMAQRHPFRLVAGAAALGGLLVLARPWRWSGLPPALTSLLLPLVLEVVRHKHTPTPSRPTHAP
ncbi:MAG: hypothetical protein PHH58_11775 [Rhodoferax sp.]|nr:hypothetical protein [Rhodoferax sp.]